LKFNEQQEKKLDSQINNLLTDITIRMREAEEMIKSITLEKSKSMTDEQIKLNIKLNLLDRITSITKDLRLNEKDYVMKYKEYVGEDLYSNANTVTNMNIDGNSQGFDFIGMTVEERKSPAADENLIRRGKEIEVLVQNIDELNVIFKDLQSLVVHQGTILDRIDFNIDESICNVSKARKELVIAEENMKSNCIRNLNFVIILVIFVECLLIMFKYV